MKIKGFKLERYFGIHEFTAKYLLSSSDCDGYELKYILDVATKEEIKLWENITLGPRGREEEKISFFIPLSHLLGIFARLFCAAASIAKEQYLAGGK